MRAIRTTSLTRTGWFLLVLLVAFSTNVGAKTQKAARPPAQLTSEEKLKAEQRLWDLGYWAGPIDGNFDAASRHALIAFQKVESRPRTGKLTRDELNALQNATRPAAKHGDYAHVEIDLERQVLFLIDENGDVFRVLPISSGNEKLYMDQGKVHRAHTPTGTFTVLRKINGWRKSTLGLLYYPSYIIGGIAVHGSPSVPANPASHGCIRVPMFAAKELSALMPVGLEVEVYGSTTATE